LFTEDLNRGGQGHFQIGRGGQYGNPLDAMVIQIRKGPLV
jgi:hypothetical protein